jgi:acetyl-CoA carboxylase carboxyl transferase subunit alpha
LSRHPSRPYTLDHIKALFGETFLGVMIEASKMIKMIGGLGKIGVIFMIIGQQKGTILNTSVPQTCAGNPEG